MINSKNTLLKRIKLMNNYLNRTKMKSLESINGMVTLTENEQNQI